MLFDVVVAVCVVVDELLFDADAEPVEELTVEVDELLCDPVFDEEPPSADAAPLVAAPPVPAPPVAAPPVAVPDVAPTEADDDPPVPLAVALLDTAPPLPPDAFPPVPLWFPLLLPPAVLLFDAAPPLVVPVLLEPPGDVAVPVPAPPSPPWTPTRLTAAARPP